MRDDELLQRITVNPEIFGGKPIVRGRRLAVEHILGIPRIAPREQRVLVTQDKDFGDLAIVFEHPHAGILRLVEIQARRQGEYINDVIERYERELATGAIATIDSNGLDRNAGQQAGRVEQAQRCHPLVRRWIRFA